MPEFSQPAFTDKVAPLQESIDTVLKGACTKVSLYEDVNGLVGATALCEMSMMDLVEKPTDNVELAFNHQIVEDLSRVATLLDHVKCTRINILISIANVLVSVGHVHRLSGRWDINSATVKLQRFLGTNLALQSFSENLISVLQKTTGKE